MTRWEPNARERLEKAAMDLFKDRGYAETTVQDIAERAGLTERTFFRYFADKREVLFAGATLFHDTLVGGVASAPPGTAPLEAVIAAFSGLVPFLESRRDLARARLALIVAHAELQERETAKLAAAAAGMAAGLRARGVPEPAATLAAEAGSAIFRVAFERWATDKKKHDLGHHVEAVRDELAAVVLAEKKTAPAKKKARSRSGPAAR